MQLKYNNKNSILIEFFLVIYYNFKEANLNNAFNVEKI